ncbi:uncharacterized protein K460DRAFT_364617 [Cucurbitaria berberidis CBS 394.84]|uniref:F-box domain-containing protein n=1 Tax=Cucurbitaria berberidis CBS 394.84 TaxID=1168544 RepID=A0A9P4GNW2_9PLEO|nr:uncharacterized protein K460DRAFT_364617 [Cucurbitaria berberidis CBS 394.84]KAF1848622.1 hypothetical protein K460DRAFT_364617 [Cucurbitaria berberidis CBS 394.84]
MANATRPFALLKLPNEILLQIALNLSGSVKQPDPQADLLSFALTCKQLAPLARESLCHAPILQSRKIHMLLKSLYTYPNLRTKTRSLTIETRESRGLQELPTPLPGLEPGLLWQSICEIHTLSIDKETQEWWIADLKATSFTFPGPLLCLLIALLPHLKELYLGGSSLCNFPLFRNMLPALDDINGLQIPFLLTQISNWDHPNLSCVMNMLSSRLTVLELPNDFRISTNANAWQVAEARGIPTYFPELRRLILPSNAVVSKPCQEIIPSKLESLVLTDARVPEIDAWLTSVARSKKQLFPCLRKVALYYRYKAPPAPQPFLQSIAAAGLDYSEYRPSCCLRIVDAFWHPWMYTADEIDASVQTMHDDFQKDLDRENAKHQLKVERERARLLDKCLLALRDLFSEDPM